MKKFRILGGNKPGIELTPEIIVKKSNLTKQMLAEGFIKLMSMIDEDTPETGDRAIMVMAIEIVTTLKS